MIAQPVRRQVVAGDMSGLYVWCVTVSIEQKSGFCQKPDFLSRHLDRGWSQLPRLGCHEPKTTSP
jgi:hypothetical protein